MDQDTSVAARLLILYKTLNSVLIKSNMTTHTDSIFSRLQTTQRKQPQLKMRVIKVTKNLSPSTRSGKRLKPHCLVLLIARVLTQDCGSHCRQPKATCTNTTRKLNSYQNINTSQAYLTVNLIRIPRTRNPLAEWLIPKGIRPLKNWREGALQA